MMTAIGEIDPIVDDQGRCIPSDGMRVFNIVSRRYYRLKQPPIDFGRIWRRTLKQMPAIARVPVASFEAACRGLERRAVETRGLARLFRGVHVPFICPPAAEDTDAGTEFADVCLPAVERAATMALPSQRFRSTVQGPLPLAGNVLVADARYQRFLRARRHGVVAGWYFPTALQEYDCASQRARAESLPLSDALTVSGGFEAAAALVGTPQLLVNEDAYAPVLCLSAFEHRDPRLMLCFKAYGPDLEFWCMSQMLTPTTTQVSEQWSGGLTLFAAAG